MNASSKPETSKVSYWLRDAAEELASIGITSALLDAEIILAHTLRKSRTWLHAHNDDTLDSRELDIANARLELRLDRTPIAYIIGHKEFYTRLFKVTPSVLIPRPESETIITLLQKYLPKTDSKLIDIGTGSGCLGITAKLEFPQTRVTLADISRHALSVAAENAESLRADVEIVQSNLFSYIPDTFDVVIANLPYVDRDWERSPETNAEPELALFADDDGLKLINRLIDQLPDHVTVGGKILIEADPVQHKKIVDRARKNHLELVEIADYIVALQRV